LFVSIALCGGLYAWEFEKNGREFNVRVEGQLVFNNIARRVDAALAGLGLAYLPEDVAQPHLAKRRLVRFSTIGVRLFQVTIFTTLAAASRYRPSPCSSMRCAIGVEWHASRP
jgi:DNA-binding transcriptional LysR family regulator